jgi:hypothetical protein
MPQGTPRASGKRLAMTTDEARKLLGAYATGSLSEAEKTALFQAALEDQELFDELAGEQVMKEVLDEPGARQRLLHALEPARFKAATWGLWAATAVVAAVGVAVVISVRTRPTPQQIAQVLKTPEPVAEVAPPPLQRKAAPSPVPTPPSVPKLADQPPAEPVPQAKPLAAADAIQEFAAVGRGGAAVGGALRAKNEAATVTLGFGFSYTVLVGGSLQITPAEPGYLTVIADDRVVFPSSAVTEFIPITIAVPSGAKSLIIGFSRTPAVTGTPVPRDALTGRETDQDPPNGRILIQLSLTPATQ